MTRKYRGHVVEFNPVRLGREILAVVTGQWSDGTLSYQECNEAGEVTDERTAYSRTTRNGQSLFIIEAVE